MSALRSAVLLLALMVPASAVRGEEPAPVDFNREIRPILSDNCFVCHGPDSGQRQADLRLDQPDSAANVIVAGSSEDSELFARVSSDDPDLLMPPADSNRRLSKEQVDRLRRWIDSGAAWGTHWSFAPPERPEVPVANSTAAAPVRNPIDAFVQARLQPAELTPAPQADRETLIRRVTLDLTGLPPTPAEIDAFLEDTDPQAYERVVDRLLKSSAYGQRMAWNWLDAARYADSNGYQGDQERSMWPWRDWVVRAFNDNLPFDQFTVWQLAGDLLPEAGREQKLATGFLRNHMINGEGGRIAEENRVDYVMDMSETTGTVWLGLTLNCCRCHDHKYDPLTRRDYYELFAFFNQTPVTGAGGNPQTPPVLAVPTEEQEARLAALEERVKTLDEERRQRALQLASDRTEWEKRQLGELQAGAWHILAPTAARAEHQTLTTLDDQSILAGGPNPANDSYTVEATTDLAQLRGLRLEALRHESLTQNSLSRAESGNFVLTELEVRVRRPGQDAGQEAKFASAQATFEQGALKAAAAFDGNPASGWAVYEGRVVDQEHQAVFVLAEPIPAGPATQLTITLRHDSPHKHHNLGRFRLAVTSAEQPSLDGERAGLLAALQTPADERTAEQSKRIVEAHQRDDPQYRRLESEREQAAGQLEALRKAVPQVMVMEDRSERRPTYLLDRGLYNKPGEEVSAAVPDYLPGAESLARTDSERPLNRLDLARWLVSPDNPLTARVTVNRFWQQLFGIGLVKTAEDFGSQGEIPIHEELLDWLACEFRDGGWDVKDLLRLIVTSHTYRQASAVDAERFERDPENRLLARGPRFRMPSWMLRDQALAASGLLVARQGGPPVNGYQPPGVWEEATFGKKQYNQDHGEALYRRSLYTFWRRIIAPTMFFDNASRQTCTVKPFRTNTPLHALVTFNDVTFVEAARALAERALKEVSPAGVGVSGTGVSDAGAALDAARLDAAYRRVLARYPGEAERKILLAGLQRTRREFHEDPEAARQLLAVGESPRDEQLEAVEHASWTALCLAILNLDSALTKE